MRKSLYFPPHILSHFYIYLTIYKSYILHLIHTVIGLYLCQVLYLPVGSFPNQPYAAAVLHHAFGSFINRYMCFILSLLIHHSHYSFLLILFFRLSSSSFQCHLITIGVLCIYFIPICTIYFHSITLLFFSFDTLKMEHCGLFFPLYLVHILFYIQVCSSFFQLHSSSWLFLSIFNRI